VNAAGANGGAGAVSSAGAANGSHGGALGGGSANSGYAGSGSMPQGGDLGAGNAAGSIATNGGSHAGGAISMAGTGNTGAVNAGGAISMGGVGNAGGAISMGGAGNAGGLPGTSGGGGGLGVGGSCGVVNCPALDCALGYFPQPVLGSCCPSCQQPTSTACSSGILSYERDQLLLAARLSTGCHTQLDCASIAVHNACEQSCVFKPVLVSSLDQYTVALTRDALAACATCPATGAVHPCSSAQLAICLNGTCVLPSGN